MSKLNWSMKACGVLLFLAVAAIALPAQTTEISSTTPTTVPMFSFDFTDGAYPYAGLVQGADGNLYGTTFGGGHGQGDEGEGYGTVFRITSGGKQEVLYDFCSQGGDECTDGVFPEAGLIQGTDGNFYGTTSHGGAYEGGTVFRITSGGKLTTLYSFCQQITKGICVDGAGPFGGVVEGPDGSFYGTTGSGGTNEDGTVFKVTPGGKLTTLYSFCAQGGNQCPDGIGPLAGLVLGTDGKFYGTTEKGGGNNDAGTVFSITAGGTLTTLHSFCSQPNCADGESPQAPLVEGTDGNFYGTTTRGDTVFKITPGGNLTTLYQFCANGVYPCADGDEPVAGLVLGTDGNFYGTTEYGGIKGFNGDNCPNLGCGTIFQITSTGDLTNLYDFCSQNECTDGNEPEAALVQDTNGTFYGTAEGGQTFGGGLQYGVVFSVSMGLGPFVETNPAAARVGKKVGILGTNLTGATSVTFHGVAASFEVKSPALIIAEVPTGATSGKVQVQLPSGTLSSNVPFIVLPLH